MTATKTNEVPGTRAVLRHSPQSASKVREVLGLIRGVEYDRALEILRFCERGAADAVEKLLRSVGANAEHNNGLDLDELFVASCYADEGVTAKRWRPRARGRATRIRKRSCHITIVLARMPDEKIARRRARTNAEAADRRARRVAGARRGRNATTTEEAIDEDVLVSDVAVIESPVVDETTATEEVTTAEATESNEVVADATSSDDQGAEVAAEETADEAGEDN